MQTQRKSQAYESAERTTAQLFRVPKNNLSKQGLASIRVKELERLSYYLALHGLSTCSRSEWLWILGSAIAIAEGIENDAGLSARRANAGAKRRGLSQRSLRESAINAGFHDVRSDELEKAIAKAKARIQTGEPIPCSRSYIGRKVELTFVVRDELRITTIDACDETRAERLARVKERRRARDRARKKAKAIRKPRAQYEAESLSRQRPWKDEGISRRTWETRRKAAGMNSSSQAFFLKKEKEKESVSEEDATSPAQAAARKRRKPAALARPPHESGPLAGDMKERGASVAQVYPPTLLRESLWGEILAQDQNKGR